MDRLWLLMAAILPIAWVIDQRDLKLKLSGFDRKERAMTFFLIVVLGFFCGLRTWGNDTVTYVQMYEQSLPLGELMLNFDVDFAHGPGFYFLTSLIKTMGFTKQDYLMFYSFATVIPYVLFMRRYSVNTVFGVFLMLTTGFYTFAMAAVKQTMATAICLCAIPMALDRKWVRFFLIICLASLFHPYALVYGIVPFMMFEPWRGKTILWVMVFVTVGFMLDSLIGTVLDITAMMGAEYSAEEMLGAGVNIFRVMVCFVPLGLAVFFGNDLFRKADESVYLMFNLAMINALIMFVGLFGTANYFARLANYFLPAQVVILPWMIYSSHPQDRRWLLSGCVAGYLMYFYYENAIIRPFDSSYPQMSLWTYWGDLISRWLK